MGIFTHSVLVAVLTVGIFSAVDACFKDNLCWAIASSSPVFAAQQTFVRSAAAAVRLRTTTARYALVTYSANNFNAVQADTTDSNSINATLDGNLPSTSGTSSMLQGLLGCEDTLKPTNGRIRICNLIVDSSTTITPEVVDKIQEMKNNEFKLSIAGIDLTDSATQNAFRELVANETLFTAVTDNNPQQLRLAASNFQGRVCNAAGQRDPHIIGFDGSHFDFHGVGGEHFTFFGRRGGDLVTCKVRAVRTSPDGSFTPATYFQEFGFQPGNSEDKLRVALLRGDLPGVWNAIVTLNGVRVLVDETSLYRPSLVVEKRGENLKIVTGENQYTVDVKRPRIVRNTHLDIGVRLGRSPRSTDEFEGVLGMTLKPLVGLSLDSSLTKQIHPAVRDQLLTKRFWVAELFPPKKEPSALHTTTRIASKDMNPTLEIPTAFSS